MMRHAATAAVVAAVALASAGEALAQVPPDPSLKSMKWEIVDNSFLVEESFNQEPGVFQNIFTWIRGRDGRWQASFTQEWPVPTLTHQFSYTIPFSSGDLGVGLNDVLLNYRYQLLTESDSRPAISPRISLIAPTGRKADALGDGVFGLQINIPASKQFGDLYIHANGGFTWLSGLHRTPHAAGGGIWRLTSMFHLVLEGVLEFADEATVATISPGFRRGWNIGDHQLVVGAAAPLTALNGTSTIALLTYFSYELPFR